VSPESRFISVAMMRDASLSHSHTAEVDSSCRRQNLELGLLRGWLAERGLALIEVAHAFPASRPSSSSRPSIFGDSPSGMRTAMA
jgi:hypothetical protein